MSEDWGELVKRYRLRHGLTQGRMATVIGVSQRTVSRWERGDDKPSLDLQRKLRDMGWEPPGLLLASLAQSVRHCPFPRALSRTQKLRLQVLSGPAIRKRPSVVNWVGRDLAPIACGILQEMQDDRVLQKSIAGREIACILTHDPQRAAHEGAPADRDLSHRDHLFLPRGDALQRRDLQCRSQPVRRWATGRLRWTMWCRRAGLRAPCSVRQSSARGRVRHCSGV